MVVLMFTGSSFHDVGGGGAAQAKVWHPNLWHAQLECFMKNHCYYCGFVIFSHIRMQLCVVLISWISCHLLNASCSRWYQINFICSLNVGYNSLYNFHETYFFASNKPNTEIRNNTTGEHQCITQLSKVIHLETSCVCVPSIMVNMLLISYTDRYGNKLRFVNPAF